MTLAQQLAAATRSGVMVLDRSVRFTIFNPMMEAMSGLPAERVIGSRPDEVFPDWSRESGFVDRVERAMAGIPTSRDHVLLPAFPGREPIWVSDDYQALLDDGAITGVLVTIRDLTVQRRADQVLRDANGFARQVIDSASDGIAVVDTNLRWVLFNPRMESIFEVPAGSVIGAHPTELWGEQAAALVERLTRTLAGERIHRKEAVPVVAHHTEWISDDYIPMRNTEGQITGALTTVRDISGYKERERAVSSAHERLSSALEAARMGVWEVELSSGQITWSQNLEMLFGRPLEAHHAFRDAAKYVHPDDVEDLIAGMEAAIAMREPFDIEFRLLPVDGSARWLRSRGRVMAAADGGPERLLGVTTDVTTRHALESQLLQAQKIESIGQLAGGIAHDFNNLLTAILGYSRFLAEGLTDSEQSRDIAEIIKAADRATTLTRQLLAFSRQQMVQPRALSLNTAIDDLMHMLRRLIGEHIQLTTELDPSIPSIHADRGQIEQVIVNLAVNARDAMPEGGKLTIRTSVTDVTRQTMTTTPLQPGRYVRLDVTDTGIGMTEQVKARVFEPFFTTKEVGKGTGLGLATVFGIVVQSGGGIAIETEPGCGAIFTLYFPAGAGVAATGIAAPAQQAPRRGGTETVLVVEDEQPVRLLTRMILERAGYHVLDAAGPQAAEEVLAATPSVAAIVTDIVMPGGTGPALVERVLTRHPRLKAVFVSGYASQEKWSPEHLPPGQRFLQKPFSAVDLTRVLRELLDE